MRDLTELKKYSMAEAIYIEVFDISDEDLKSRPREEVISDYAHLEENVEEALECLGEREQLILRRVLSDKQKLHEVGEELDISKSRVGAIVRRVLQRFEHKYYKQTLDGTRRQWRIEAEAEKRRKESVKEAWIKVEAEIAQQREKQQARIDELSSHGIEYLALTKVCEQKLRALGVETIGELLGKFPFDQQTNGLTGLAIADEIEKTDYQEVWSALFMNGLLVHLPELPDFDALKKAEQAAKAREIVMNDGISPEAIAMNIDELELSVRSYNCVKRHGIRTVGELLVRLKKSASEYLELDRQQMVDAIIGLDIRNLGRKSAEEVANCLCEVLCGEFK